MIPCRRSRLPRRTSEREGASMAESEERRTRTTGFGTAGFCHRCAAIVLVARLAIKKRRRTDASAHIVSTGNMLLRLSGL
jgi:hypothetical protein